MYLSRLILNPRHRQVQWDLADPYQLHRTVLSGFPKQLPGEERVLYRLDSDSRQARLALLVQSQCPPDWTGLAAGYLLPPISGDPLGANPATKAFDPAVRRGQTLQFRLQANPTKRLGKSYGGDAGKRVGLYRPDEQMAWLHRKAEQGGFRILSALPSQQDVQHGRARRIQLFTVRFDGVLQVADPEQFAAALAEGIGSAKAFGCGLLSVAPAH